MTSESDIQVVCSEKSIQGECPIWHAAERALYWIDTRKPAIQRLDANGVLKVWTMPAPIGSIAFRAKGGLLAATQQGFCTVDLESGAVTAVVDPEPQFPHNRMNDGKCDRRGRFWCGSRNSDAAGSPGKETTGSIYRLDADFSCVALDREFIVPNGMAFSPDDRHMLLADSAKETLYIYDFDLERGSIDNRRVFFSTQDMPGRVDGATYDADGYYWCTLINDWSIARLDPDGKIERLIRVPVRRPTMCCFGGDNYDVLYVTTSSLHMNDEDRRVQPHAGALLAIHGTGAHGLPEPSFAG